MRILIVYTSREGQTAKIAHEMAGALRSDACEVEVVRAQDAPGPEGFDALILGAPIHAGKHHPDAVAWVKRHRGAVEKTHSAFYSVSLAAASKDPSERAEAENLAEEFCTETGWRPELIACFAGSLAYSQYGLIKKLIMRRITAKEGGDTNTAHDYEYTDWDSVVAFARNVARSVSGSESAAHAG